MRKKWTPDEIARAQKMKADGFGTDEIADGFGVTFFAMRALLRREYNQAYRKTYKRRYRPERRITDSSYVKTVEVPETALTDRNCRAAAMRSLTALFCGDPPPGFSAIDKKRAEHVG